MARETRAAGCGPAPSADAILLGAPRQARSTDGWVPLAK
jgi:hypothetical protein